MTKQHAIDRAVVKITTVAESVDIPPVQRGILAAALRDLIDASSPEPTARIDIARWSSSQYLGAPKAGDICTYCGEQWLQDPGGGAGIWHNCHT